MNHYQQQAVEATESVTAVDLASLTINERRLHLRRMFHKTTQPIQAIGIPSLCETYPDYAEDIIQAYLDHTLFTARVLVNYDAACKKFYPSTDGRTGSCGVLMLKADDEKRLEKIGAKNVQLKRVKLAVGTAFETLCK